jgi:hypothetical protein
MCSPKGHARTIPCSISCIGARQTPSRDFDGDARASDNLYTNSVIALDPNDGAIEWHDQWTPRPVLRGGLLVLHMFCGCP